MHTYMHVSHWQCLFKCLRLLRHVSLAWPTAMCVEIGEHACIHARKSLAMSLQMFEAAEARASCLGDANVQLREQLADMRAEYEQLLAR